MAAGLRALLRSLFRVLWSVGSSLPSEHVVLPPWTQLSRAPTSHALSPRTPGPPPMRSAPHPTSLNPHLDPFKQNSELSLCAQPRVAYSDPDLSFWVPSDALTGGFNHL